MSGESPTILLADDDELDVRLTQKAIQAAVPQACVVACHDGEEALAALRGLASGGERQPDLILMDFKMPKLGCLDVLRQLNDREFVSKVPVVIFSSSVGPTDVNRCISEGVRDYVEKPTDPDKYKAAVGEICRRYVTLL
jgi:CheY-like chemotaxis protein